MNFRALADFIARLTYLAVTETTYPCPINRDPYDGIELLAYQHPTVGLTAHWRSGMVAGTAFPHGPDGINTHGGQFAYWADHVPADEYALR